MSTAGQAAGGLVGGIAGFFLGGPTGAIYGAQIGLMAGGYLDPPKGPKGTPPSASDLAVQTATYGAPLGRGYGTYGTLGNVFWVEGNTLRAQEKEAEGGKGGGPAGPSTFEIFGTFAVGFGEGEIDGYGRIWFGAKLVCDYRSANVGTILATNENGGSITLYTGSASQLPDDRIQADLGAANTPAWRGLHYIVVKDWPMADFGNTLMGLQVKAEIIQTATFAQYSRLVYIEDDLLPRTSSFPGAGSTEPGYFNPRIEDGIFRCDKSNDAVGYEYAYTMGVDYEGNFVSQGVGIVDTGAFGYIGRATAGAVTYDGNTTGTFKVGGAAWKVKTSDPNNTYHGMAVGGDGRIYALAHAGGVPKFEIYDGTDLSLISSQTHAFYGFTVGNNHISWPVMPGVYTTFCVEPDGVHCWIASAGGGDSNVSLYQISATGVLSLEHDFVNVRHLGQHGIFSCIAAANGLMFGTHNAGGFYVFSRQRVISGGAVPLADIIAAECVGSGLLTLGDINVSAISQTVRGYKISQTAAIRAALEPLQAAWPFDVIPHGYQIKFVPRGGASVATVALGELGCVDGNANPGVRITASREMDLQLPRRVSVSYIDQVREYDLNTGPGAERMNTDAVNVLALELPIVMTADEAAQVEEVLLYMYWLERHDLSFVLPPSRLNLEAADVITINGDAATYEVRLSEINYLPDGRMECRGKLNNAAVYTSAAVGQEGQSVGQVLAYPGPTALSLLDIPCVDSAVMNAPGLLTAASGYSSSWPGGTVFRSDDSEQTWSGVQGFRPPGCVVGSAVSVIGAGATHVIDATSRLSVRILFGTLSSVSADSMFNGANHFAYGAHGRWEVIAAQNCTLEADGSYTLTNLMRGRFGSEQYMTTHALADEVVLLDSAAVRFVGMGIETLNLARPWRAVTSGRPVDSAASRSLAYTGVNLKPLSPVRVTGSRGINGDWALKIEPRSRIPFEVFSGVAQTSGETTEQYSVQVCSADYATVYRTIMTSSPSFSYTATQQVADFGDLAESLYLSARQVSSVFGLGYPRQSTVINLTPYDPWIASRWLAVRMNGANGSTTFTDLTGNHSLTAADNAQITTATYAVNDSSATFDGTSDRIALGASNVLDWMHKGTESWTVILRLRATVVDGSNYRTILSNFTGGTLNPGVILRLDPNGALVMFIGNNLNYTNVLSAGTGSITQNSWHYVEFNFDHTKSTGAMRIFVDGVLKATSSAAGAYSALAAEVAQAQIGAYASSFDLGWIGQMQEFLIYRGVSGHSANYSPPATPFA